LSKDAYYSRHTQLQTELRNLLSWARRKGLRLAVFSTHAFDVGSECSAAGLPVPDVVLTKTDIPGEIAKGSPRWVEELCNRLSLSPHQLAYVGDDVRDWRTAINSGVFYLHAGWTGRPSGVTAVVPERPDDVRIFLTHFLLPPPRWEFVLNRPELGFRVRSLLNASAKLAASSRPSFTLQDVFTYETKVHIDENNARDLLGLHALTSLYSEGLMRPNSFFAVYPSSKPGTVNPVLKQFVQPAARLFKGYYREDIVIRTKQAPDTSLERVAAKKEGRQPQVFFETQANSVRLNPYYKAPSRLGKPGRHVIVCDDFTTKGMSLDWARALLVTSGASDVTLVTIGKYGSDYSYHVPALGVTIQPFEDGAYAPGSFTATALPMEWDSTAPGIVAESFRRWRDGDALPTSSYL
jgi:hypothetical protein